MTNTVQLRDDVRSVPRYQVWDFYAPEEPDGEGGHRMEFRLFYHGPLPPESCKEEGKKGRAADKQRLRKHFHPQLKRLWAEHPDLQKQADQYYGITVTPSNQISYPGPNVRQVFLYHDKTAPGVKTWLEHIASEHIRCNGNKFVPLIRKSSGFTCELDVLFLRRDSPGNIISSHGDIDNRLKVLLDGLRLPIQVSELGGLPIEPDEEPFHCLLEDDSLITKMSVTTDRLITPLESEQSMSDVILVVHVTMANPSSIFDGGRLP